jgi:threonine/homoserine/homoserine lactone efflux protein
VLPDHWIPLAVLGRTRHYPLARVARLSALAGITHVLVSVILGAVIVVVGLQFRSTVEHAQDAIVGGVLIATGVTFVYFELRGRGHHHDHPHPHPPPETRLSGLAAVIVPFGAAASPDLTILPVFLAAAAAGPTAAIGSLVVFAAVTIGTIVTLTLMAAASGYQVRGRWLDRWGNAITALVLVVIGGLIAAGVL